MNQADDNVAVAECLVAKSPLANAALLPLDNEPAASPHDTESRVVERIDITSPRGGVEPSPTPPRVAQLTRRQRFQRALHGFHRVMRKPVSEVAQPVTKVLQADVGDMVRHALRARPPVAADFLAEILEPGVGLLTFGRAPIARGAEHAGYVVLGDDQEELLVDLAYRAAGLGDHIVVCDPPQADEEWPTGSTILRGEQAAIAGRIEALLMEPVDESAPLWLFVPHIEELPRIPSLVHAAALGYARGTTPEETVYGETRPERQQSALGRARGITLAFSVSDWTHLEATYGSPGVAQLVHERQHLLVTSTADSRAADWFAELLALPTQHVQGLSAGGALFRHAACAQYELVTPGAKVAAVEVTPVEQPTEPEQPVGASALELCPTDNDSTSQVAEPAHEAIASPWGSIKRLAYPACLLLPAEALQREAEAA